MVVISSSGSRSPTRTEHGLNARPLMWDVQALQTLMPQPYLGPVTPSRSRSTHSTRTSSWTSRVTGSPLRMKVWVVMSGSDPQTVSFSPLVGEAGMGGTNGFGVKASGSRWLIGKYVGIVFVARA